uniref:Uncharacterized protein n=1 Tax=Neogobius melanostomus TaxID=47308 RepID=A0A8C6T743_9GOBI
MAGAKLAPELIILWSSVLVFLYDSSFRKDEDSCLVFLLGDQAQKLTEKLDEREAQMNKCVEDLEHCAKKLKYMNIGRLVSTLVSSFMGAIGGVFSLTGLGLMTIKPKEASVLLLTGLIVAALSGVTNLITLIADWLENRKRKMKANSVCEELKGHMKDLQFCMNSATFSPTERIPEQDQITSGISIGSKFVSLVRLGDIISDLVLDIVSKEEADILQVVLKGPWSKSKFSRPFGLTTNSIFLFMDLCIIVSLFGFFSVMSAELGSVQDGRSDSGPGVEPVSDLGLQTQPGNFKDGLDWETEKRIRLM